MKKIYSIALILFMMFWICGCSISNNEITNNNTPIDDNTYELPLDKKQEASPTNKRYILSDISIRSFPSTTAEIVGTVHTGENYLILESNEDEGYTWYRIGDNQWIADDGTWTSDYCVVIFKSNNGTNEETQQEYGVGSDDFMMDYISLDSNPFVTSGYVFVGWNTEPDGTGVYFSEKQSIKFVCSDSTNVYLYAQWVPVKETNVKITAVNDLEVIDRPSFSGYGGKVYTWIREGDSIQLLNIIDYDNKQWGQISSDKWIIFDDNNVLRLDDSYDVYNLNINAMNYTLPTRTESFMYEKDGKTPINDSSAHITYIFHRNADGSLSYVSNNYPFDNYVAYGDEYVYRPFGIPSLLYYGDHVENEYDANGRIIKQKLNYQPYNVNYNLITYDESGKIIKKVYVQNPSDRSSDIEYVYEYDSLGRLISSRGIMGSRSFDETTYEYNGNYVLKYIVFSGIDINTGETKRLDPYLESLFRYDSTGRIIEHRYNYGIGASDLLDYYYYE